MADHYDAEEATPQQYISNSDNIHNHQIMGIVIKFHLKQ
jgi:hypothetical protein